MCIHTSRASGTLEEENTIYFIAILLCTNKIHCQVVIERKQGLKKSAENFKGKIICSSKNKVSSVNKYTQLLKYCIILYFLRMHEAETVLLNKTSTSVWF